MVIEVLGAPVKAALRVALEEDERSGRPPSASGRGSPSSPTFSAGLQPPASLPSVWGMAEKVSAKKAAVRDEADPRFDPVAKAFARRRGFSLMESKSRAMRGLMLNRKSFGMSSNGRLILKMSEARVAELISTGTAKPFAPSPGKVMKGWLEVTHPDADWVALATEAFDLAAAGSVEPPARKRAAVKKAAKR